ncbi:MAG TPA: hypothetical protein VNL14_21185 [Candidatus Acidoferrales bacterium]|nr:hypothetical protein [Candidatus Acidoferrales bacterium]
MPDRAKPAAPGQPSIVGQRSPRFAPARRVIILPLYGFYPYAPRFYVPPYHYDHVIAYPNLYPYFCFFDGLAFTNQAGFLDHVAGVHKIPLSHALSFCNENGSSCWLGY